MEFCKSLMVSVFLVVLCIIPKYEFTSKHEIGKLIQDNDAKEQFDRLLTSIANINKARINALERYNALESYNAGGLLRNTNYDPGVNKKESTLLTGRKHVDEIHKDEHANFFDFDYAGSAEVIKKKLRNKVNQLQGTQNVSHISEEFDDDYDEDEEEIEDDKNYNDKVEDDKNDNDKIEDDKNDNDEIEDDNDLVNFNEDDQTNYNMSYVGDKDVAVRHWGHGKLSCSGGKCNCITACKCAYKSFCAKFGCSKDMHVSFCRNCRLNCRSKFIY